MGPKEKKQLSYSELIRMERGGKLWNGLDPEAQADLLEQAKGLGGQNDPRYYEILLYLNNREEGVEDVNG